MYQEYGLKGHGSCRVRAGQIGSYSFDSICEYINQYVDINQTHEQDAMSPIVNSFRQLVQRDYDNAKGLSHTFEGIEHI